MEQSALQKNVSYKNQHLIAFAAAAVVAAISFYFAGIMPGSDWVDLADSFTQSAAFARMLLRHLFDGAGMFYSHEISLGQNTSLVYAMYGYSPFTLFYLLPFDTYTVMVITYVFRCAFAAVFFELFLRKGMEIKSRSTIFFALCYGLCAFHIYFLNSANFAEGVYLFPLLMWMLLSFIKSGKRTGLCLCYVLCFVSNFYAGYIIGISSCIALLIYLFLRDGKAFIKNNIRSLVNYAVLVLTALSISMLFLIPAFTFYIKTMSGAFNGSFLNTASPLTLLSSLFWGIHNELMSDYAALYAGTPTLLLLLLYFFNRRFSKKERLVMLGALLSLIAAYYLDPLYLALHAFNPPMGFPMRFAYIYIFLMVMLAARQYTRFDPSILKEKSGQLIFLAVYCCICVFLLICGREAAVYVIAINLILPIVWVLWSAFLKNRIPAAVATVSAIALLGMEMSCGIAIGYPDDVSGAYYRYYISQLPETIERIKKDQGDGQLFRARVSNALAYNLASEYGYSGSGIFSTAVYPNLQMFMLRMGDNISGFTYTMEGLTDFMEMLLGIRYQARLDSPNDPFNKDLYYYEINQHALPLGFAASEEILSLPSLGINPFENQNAVLSALSGKEQKAYIATPLPELAVQAMDAAYLEGGGLFMQRLYDDAPGMASFSVPKEGYRHAYFMFSNLSEDRTPTERKKAPDEALLSLYSEKDRYTNGVRDERCLDSNKGVIEMDEDDELFYILLMNRKYLGTETVIDHVFTYYQDDACLNAAYDELSTNGWNISSSDGSHISATITVTEEHPILFMSIPYDTGWKCSVDGTDSEILPVIDSTFSTVVLTPGTHKIKLTYKAPGLNAGILCFIAGFICLVIFIILDRNAFHRQIG